MDNIDLVVITDEEEDSYFKDPVGDSVSQGRIKTCGTRPLLQKAMHRGHVGSPAVGFVAQFCSWKC